MRKGPDMKLAALLLAAVLTLASCLQAPAEEITLAWDPQPAPTEPGLNIRFRIEQLRPAPWADAGQWKQVAWDIAGTTVTLPAITAGPVSFRAFAYLKEFPGIEAAPSAVLEATAELPPVEGLRKVKVALQSSTDLKEWKEIASVEKDATAAEFFRAEVTTLPR